MRPGGAMDGLSRVARGEPESSSTLGWARPVLGRNRVKTGGNGAVMFTYWLMGVFFNLFIYIYLDKVWHGKCARKHIGGGFFFDVPDFRAGKRGWDVHVYCAPLGEMICKHLRRGQSPWAPAVRPTAFGRSAPERRRGMGGVGTKGGENCEEVARLPGFAGWQVG